MYRTFTAVVALVAAAAVWLSACSRAPAGPVALSLESPALAVASGLTSEEIAGLKNVPAGDLSRIFRVRVKDAADAIAGSYRISRDRIEFTPAFPFDGGREYVIELDQDRLPGHRHSEVLAKNVSLAVSTASSPLTRVVSVEPTAEIWPANLLRVYIHFSAPMSRETGVGQITLRDHRGEEVTEAFLPLEADFWSPDHRRFTLFFDPGRVKRGILPNRQRGRALVSGRRYALEISAAWRDAEGRPLGSGFRHEFAAGPAIERPMRVEDWRVAAVRPGTREPLAVTFPWPVDRGLAVRSLVVRRTDGRPIEGQGALDRGDARWVFTPAQDWISGEYRLEASPILEDPSGNQIGRAFEVDMKREPQAPPNVARTIAFRVAAR